MSTNDTIIQNISHGSFKFPIEFELFNTQHFITDAVFDTGCSHSLISANSLNIGNKSIDDLQEEALYDPEVLLYIGKGVESQGVNTFSLSAEIKKINSYKKQLVKKKIPKNKAIQWLKNNISASTKGTILNEPKVRYAYSVSNYSIDGVLIGDFEVRVAFKLDRVNLIGMHIIKELYTKIFPRNDEIYLLAKKNSPLADCELDIAMDELADQIDLYDDEEAVRDSNYINKIHNN